MSEFTDKQIERILENRPEDLRMVKDNRSFISKIRNQQITKDKADIPVFGVKSVNVNAILKNNIHNHTIFTIDKLCRMHKTMRYEQLKKYQRKRRTVPFNMYWLIIMIMLIAVALLVIVFLLPKFGSVM